MPITQKKSLYENITQKKSLYENRVKTEQNSPMWQNKSFTVATLYNCLPWQRRAIVFLLEENAATLFARFLRGVVRQGCWMCFLAPLEMVVLLTLVQPEWTDYVHHEQTNKHYYEHPRIWKHNDTSVTKAVQCCAIKRGLLCKSQLHSIARPNKKRGLPL